MAVVEAVFAQAPRHHTTKLILRNDITKLASNQRGGIPSPEQLVSAVEVVLSAGLVVRDAVGQRLLPRARDVFVLASCAEGVPACASAVFGGASAVAVETAAVVSGALRSLLRAACAVGALRQGIRIIWNHVRLLKGPGATCLCVFAVRVLGGNHRAVERRGWGAVVFGGEVLCIVGEA